MKVYSGFPSECIKLLYSMLRKDFLKTNYTKLSKPHPLAKLQPYCLKKFILQIPVAFLV